MNCLVFLDMQYAVGRFCLFLFLLFLIVGLDYTVLAFCLGCHHCIALVGVVPYEGWKQRNLGNGVNSGKWHCFSSGDWKYCHVFWWIGVIVPHPHFIIPLYPAADCQLLPLHCYADTRRVEQCDSRTVDAVLNISL